MDWVLRTTAQVRNRADWRQWTSNCRFVQRENLHRSVDDRHNCPIIGQRGNRVARERMDERISG
jgi:hypothetical protein